MILVNDNWEEVRDLQDVSKIVREHFNEDLADKVIAVWDGTKGGTGNCVKYAEKCGKEIIRIEP